MSCIHYYLLSMGFLLGGVSYSQSLPKAASTATDAAKQIKQKVMKVRPVEPSKKIQDAQSEYDKLLEDKLNSIKSRPLQPEVIDVDPKKPKPSKEVPDSIKQKGAVPKKPEVNFYERALKDYREQTGNKSFSLDDDPTSAKNQKIAQTEYERITKELEQLNKIDQAKQDEETRIYTQQAIKDAKSNLRQLDKYKKYKKRYEKQYKKELDSKGNSKLGVLNDDEFLESGGLEDDADGSDPFMELQDDVEDEDVDADE